MSDTPESPPRPPRFDVERVRFAGERAAAAAMRGDVWLQDLIMAAEARGKADPSRIKRSLMARSLKLTEGMAPDTWRAARAAAAALGVTESIEIFQSAGAENAAIHLVDAPVFLEIRGRLLSLLDDAGTVAVFGHELGHYLAHGPGSPDGALGMVVHAAMEHGGTPEHAQRHASKLSMAREITADRFGLLACGDLDAALRLEMAAATGLASGDLTWDTKAYLAQCRALIEETAEAGQEARGTTHPEHGMRAWALWLFSESDLYKELTGQGPGTWILSEVDEEIAAVLGAAPSEGLLESALLLDPIPEVHECALAAAVLVALADNVLAEEESLAIEKVFAHLVPDWQRYLTWDNAIEAFSDTGAVVIAGGARVQRSVFQVLIHVLAADGEVTTSEIEMVCSVGDALRCGTMYRALLTPVLKALGAEVPDLDAVEHVIPMPAREDEAQAALEVFLGGIVRRGGGEATPRRMFRLLGDREGSGASRALLLALIERLGLECTADLEQTELDTPVALTLTPETRARQAAVERPPPPDIDAPDRTRLTHALTRLRDQLVSGDGRSPSIRLRRSRRGRSFDLFALESLSVGHAERVLTLVQSAAAARVVDGKEVGVHEGAELVSRELVALEREALLRQEQTGARNLFVGAPFLTGVFRGYLVRAPLILHPFDLERSQGRGFRLVPRADDPPVANQALIRLLFAKKNVSFPDELGEDLDTAAAEGLDALRSVLADQGIVARPEGEALKAFDPRDEAFATWPEGRVVVEPCAVLGFFPQSSSDMIQDYDGLLAAIADPSVDLAARLGAAGALLPADLREALGVSAEVPPSAAPLVPVVLADPTQRGVLSQARTSRALVVDGPPGTGKSQVIVNLVADALARGETVAVVCEKRAALDVVAQRLEQLGLRHLLAVVHDVHDDRRGLYDQVVKRLGEAMLRDHDGAVSERVASDLADVQGALRGRREALAMALGDEHPSLGQLHVLASSFHTPPLDGLDPSMMRLTHDTIRRLAERLGREARNLDLHTADSPWRAPEGGLRPTLAAATPDQLAEVEDLLREARPAARDLDGRREACGVHEDLLRPAASLLREVVTTREVRGDRLSKDAFAAWLRRGDDPGLAVLVQGVRETWADASEWVEVAPEKVRFEGSPELDGALAVTGSWAHSIFRFFSWGWWQARSVVKATLATQWPAALVASFDAGLLARIGHRKSGAAAWKALDKLLVALQLTPVLPDSATARVTVDVLLATWSASRPLVAGESTLRGAGAWPDQDLASWDAAVDARLSMLASAEALAAAFDPARRWFPWREATPTEAAVQALHEAWAMDAARVVGSDRNVDAAAATCADARQVLGRLADGVPEGSDHDWSDALEHGWAVLGLKGVERRFPGTRQLDRATPHGEVGEAEARLTELVGERAALHVTKVLADCDRVDVLTEARPEKGSRRNGVQKIREQMLREASKRRYVLSLRTFVRQFADGGLMRVLPVWLVSPETMAILFPGTPVFDLVVMDEASQCTVEKGLPALVRGHRAVVAGDEKQMPPTSFFELRAPDEEEIGTAETVEADALTAESLLVLARERCRHEGLRWHYRCLHEELIAFSNHAMYGGDLFTIPSTSTVEAGPALRWVAVEDGAYDEGGNPIEAERVVDLVDELMKRSEPPSIGVVTFNIQQRRIVLDALDQRAEQDEAFGARYAVARSHAELDQRPFVKNLESVQGDERDVIIFSLGHAPVPRRSGPLAGQLYVPARFGPLGQAGGERRLNVAVSRAKRECFVVASFDPSMLSVVNTLNEGPKLLKSFLEFVWDLTHGRRLQASKTLDRVRHGGLGDRREARARVGLGAPPLAALIGLRLEAEGIPFDLDVGSSGFRVPLALRDPTDPAAYKVAVLTDEGAEVGDVDELHRHQPGVLRARGWTVVRVDARSWHKNPDAVTRRLVAALGPAAP